MKRSKEVQAQEKELALRNFKFNRFLFIRYALAFSVIANLYWLFMNLFTQISSVVVPLMMVILGGMAAFEYIKVYWVHENKLKYSKIYFQAQFIMNIGLFLLSLNDSVFAFLYPFIEVTPEARMLVYGILAIGMVIAGVSLFKIHRIHLNKDKKYQYIQRYEKYSS